MLGNRKQRIYPLLEFRILSLSLSLIYLSISVSPPLFLSPLFSSIPSIFTLINICRMCVCKYTYVYMQEIVFGS